MKRILNIILIIIISLLLNINVNAESIIYNIEEKDDIDDISNYDNIEEIIIKNITLDDLSFLNDHKNIEKITILNSTININSIDDDLLNRINYQNCFIKGEFNNNYKFKESDKIVNTEYNYNPKYDEEFSKMAKYIYKDGMSNNEIIKSVTLFVLDYMQYDKTGKIETSNSCYNHYGICSNYTELESVLLSKLGIYAITINGYTNINDEINSYHSWNLIYLNDTWYIIDPVYLDLYDSGDAIRQNLNVEYYMKEVTSDFKANHIAYYNYLNIPTDFLESRLSILDRLDEIGEYQPTEVEEPVNVVEDENLNDEIAEVVILSLIAIVMLSIVVKYKKKKSTR